MPDTTTPTTKPTAAPFKLERSLIGVAQGYMEVAERVVNGTLDTNQAREASRALGGIPAVVKTQLEAIRLFEKGSEKARMQAAKILDLGIGSEQAALQ